MTKLLALLGNLRATGLQLSTVTAQGMILAPTRCGVVIVLSIGWVFKLTTLEGKQANALCWTPSGRFIIIAWLNGFNGQLYFYNLDELDTMATEEHFMTTSIEWDPTGRYSPNAHLCYFFGLFSYFRVRCSLFLLADML